MPQTIGRYLLKAQLGRGGMGTVYLGYDPRVERDVAIKVLPREFLHEPMFQARFEREAKTIAVLDHPAVVPIHDYGKENDQPYLVMRYMSGGTLTDRLRVGRLGMAEILAILKRIGPAMDEAHKLGIYHRDIKPSNILFDKYGHAYLSDFGMVRLEASSSELTGSHAAIGTPGYMSPEQIRGAEIDSRSDVYSLGVVLFEMLTARRPFSAETPAMIIVKQITGPVPRIRQVYPQLPQPYDDIVFQLMSKQAANRPGSAAEVINLLTKALEAQQAQSDVVHVGVIPDGPSDLAISTPPPTEIMRAISDNPLPPPPNTMSLAVYDITTFSDRDLAEQLSDESIEIYCPKCRQVLNVYGQTDPITCSHCRHQFDLAGHLCPYCFTFHQDPVTLCVNCDTPVTRVCRECMAPNWAGAERCKQCGLQLDIFSILQLPSKHKPAERTRHKEKQLKILKQVEEKTSERRMAEIEAERDARNGARRSRRSLLLATLLVVLLIAILAVLLLVYGVRV